MIKEWNMEAKEYCARANTKSCNEDYAGAIEDYNKAIELDNECEQAYFDRALCKLELKDYKGAIEDYNFLAQRNDFEGLPDVYYFRSCCYSSLENHTKALNDLNKAIELNTECAVYHLVLAGLYQFKEEFDKALVHYERANELDSSYKDESREDICYCAFHIGDKLLHEKQYTKALEYFNRVLELDNNHERAYVQRAYCRGILDDYNGAIDDYKVALTLNTDDSMTYYNLGYVTYKQDNTKGTEYFTTFIEKASPQKEHLEEVANAYYLRGLTYMANKAYTNAIEDFTKAIEAGFKDKKIASKIEACNDKIMEMSVTQ